MSYSPNQMFSAAATEADANFKDRKFKDSTAPGVYDGTPLKNILFNQNLSFWDALLNKANLDYNDTEDTPQDSQLFNALELIRPVENKIKASQLVVQGLTGDALPVNGVLTSYLTGAEVAFGWFASGAVTNLTKDVNGNVILDNPGADTGILYSEIELAENLEVANLIYSVMQWNSVDGRYDQIYGTGANGITLSEPVSGTARITIDLTVLTDGFVVGGISEHIGLLEVESTTDIEDSLTTDQSLTTNGYKKLPGGLIMQWGRTVVASGGSTAIPYPITFPTAVFSVTIGSQTQGNANQAVTLTSNSGFSVYSPGIDVTGTGTKWMAVGH